MVITFGRFLFAVTSCALGYAATLAVFAFFASATLALNSLWSVNLLALFIVAWFLALAVGMATVVPASLIAPVPFSKQFAPVVLCVVVSVGFCFPPPSWFVRTTFDISLFVASIIGGLAAGVAIGWKNTHSPGKTTASGGIT